MCGFVISSNHINGDNNGLNLIRRRGPDRSSYETFGNLHIYHFLLHLTGSENFDQPYLDGDIAIVFNGEIYNYKELKKNSNSEVESLLHIYKEVGVSFTKLLDGEFFLVLIDLKKDIILISSDTFKTKPGYFYVGLDYIHITSYASCNPKDAPLIDIEANSTIIYSLSLRVFLTRFKVTEFDLDQYKTDYEEYHLALEESILKRIPENDIPLVMLSSGMDSGSIACCLDKFQQKAFYISFPKNENQHILNQRSEQLRSKVNYLELTEEDVYVLQEELLKKCEPGIMEWEFRNLNVGNGIILEKFSYTEDILCMSSSLALYKSLAFAKKRVLLTGLGADEIMAVYREYLDGSPKSFPIDLNSIFPWNNFYKGSNKNYLSTYEKIGGSIGYELRYPFLDKKLVQEFLHLSPKLKNNDIKPAVFSYLVNNNFPVFSEKRGFNV